MPPLGIPGGPFKSFKYGGLNLHPKEDATPEVEFSGRDFDVKITGDDENYSEATSKPGMILCDCVMDLADYKTLSAMKDGSPRAGTATDANGNVLSINAAINGEMKLVNGVVSLNLAGKVRMQ